MPSNAHLMVGNNDQVMPGDVIAKIPRETAVISEIDGVVRQGGIVKGMRKILVVPDDGGEAREYSLRGGVHVNVRKAIVSRRSSRASVQLTARATRTTSSRCSERRNCSRTWSTRSRRSIVCRASASTTNTSVTAWAVDHAVTTRWGKASRM